MNARKSSSKKIDLTMVPFLLFGALFGYFLSKARATDYDTIINMFLFKDFQLYGVLAVSVLVIGVVLLIFRLKNIKSREGDKLAFENHPFEWNRLAGGLIFGAGWALAGACPATAAAQLGEGKFIALFTIIGILLGIWVYMKFMEDTNSDCDM